MKDIKVGGMSDIDFCSLWFHVDSAGKASVTRDLVKALCGNRYNTGHRRNRLTNDEYLACVEESQKSLVPLPVIEGFKRAVSKGAGSIDSVRYALWSAWRNVGSSEYTQEALISWD